MPLISVITPVFNNERYIKNVARSVLQQSFRDIEYIIVDDGSTDNTPKIVDEIAEKDTRVKAIHQENQWIFASYNNGIRAAQGEYIYIVNSDDILRKGSLELMAERVYSNRPDVIWTPVLAHQCDSEQNILKYDYLGFEKLVEKDEFYQTKEQVRKEWYKFDKMQLSSNQCNLYKRELALKHPFQNNYYGADYLFNIQIANDVETAYVMHTPVYDFMNYQSDSMNTSIGKYYEYEHEMRNLFYIENKKLYEKWNQWEGETKQYISRRRLRGWSGELNALNSEKCKISLENKIEKIMFDVQDEIIESCVQVLEANEELECRTLSGIRNILINEKLDETSNYYFIYELLDSLTRYEKTEDDYKKIENAINHPLNKARIGQVLYQKISDKKYLF